MVETVESSFDANMVNLMMTIMNQMIKEQSVVNLLERMLTLDMMYNWSLRRLANSTLKTHKISRNKDGTGLHILAQFNRVATLDIQVKVMEFHERFQVDWS